MFYHGFKYFPFKEITLMPKAWPKELAGLRIVQLSDLHISKKASIEYLQELVERINTISPDIVVFTGDIIECKTVNIDRQLSVFAKINAPKYYVTGNHDIFYDPYRLEKIMQQCEVVLMDNRFATITFKGQELQLAGLSDRYSFIRGRRRPTKELFQNMKGDVPTILLAHQPKDIYLINDQRVDLQLSGHTHAGQVYPFNFLVKMVQPFLHGAYTVSDTLLYVTSGLGYWGVNIRYKAEPEIPVITIMAP